MAACVVVTGLVSALALSASVAAQPRRHVTIAAGAVDGVYYPIAGAMSRITSDARGLSVRATVESSAGSVANVQLIRSGEADFALLQNDIAYYAFNGIALGAFAGKPVKGMAGVFSVYPELVHIVVSPAAGVKSAGQDKIQAARSAWIKAVTRVCSDLDELEESGTDEATVAQLRGPITDASDRAAKRYAAPADPTPPDDGKTPPA